MAEPLVAVFTASSQTGKACVQALLGRHNANVRAIFRSEVKAEACAASYGAGPALLETVYVK